MIETEIIELPGGAALGIRHLLGNKPPWLLIIQAEKGYLACKYINQKFVDTVGDCAAIVEKASTFEEMLNTKVAWVSKAGVKLGIKKGMLGKEALERMI